MLNKYGRRTILNFISFLNQCIEQTNKLINNETISNNEIISNNEANINSSINTNKLQNLLPFQKIDAKRQYEAELDKAFLPMDGHINTKYLSTEDKQFYQKNYINNNSTIQSLTNENITQQEDINSQDINSQDISGLIESGNIEQLPDNFKNVIINTLEKEAEENTHRKHNEIIQQQIQKQLQEFYIKIHPEETLLPFIEQKLFADIDSYNITPIMHDYILNTVNEYDKYTESHIAFISDFYPVNNIDVSILIKQVRNKIESKDLNNSVIEIYKHWLSYLKFYNQDYHLYDWRNYNDKGEFISRQDQNNDDILDNFISNISEVTLKYDEVADKEKIEQAFQYKMNQELLTGKYVSNVDPELTNFYRQYTTDPNFISKLDIYAEIKKAESELFPVKITEKDKEDKKDVKELYVNK